MISGDEGEGGAGGSKGRRNRLKEVGAKTRHVALPPSCTNKQKPNFFRRRNENFLSLNGRGVQEGQRYSTQCVEVSRVH